KVLTSPINLPLRAACCFDDQGQIDAGAYISGLAELFEESGGLIVENCRISEVSREQETHIANTERGTLRASRLIYATHIPPGVNQYSVLCAPYRSYAIAFTLADGSYPDGLVYDMKDPYNYFRTQRIGGQDYVIAGGFDHKTGHQENTDYIFTELEAFVRNYFSIDKIAYRWSSQYYEPADGLPYIGKFPGRDETYLATGFSGNGYTFGTLSALIISDLIKNGKSEYEDVFDPGRLNPIASAKNLFTENVDVLTKLIGGLFKDEKLEFWSELAPGEGKIVEWEGESLAVYRSESRELYVVDPICPHLGCKVNWNTTEKSWDCPCHGSRFACDGTLLTGPASSGLRRYDIELANSQENDTSSG
ncbi:MAG: FAD-dependent oxidoreductase, partial [Spirosomataceae bacterium]